MLETELPPYKIRVSERARRISLRFSPEKGLELIIPSPRHERKALEFLKSKRVWVEKRQQEFSAFLSQKKGCALPQKIELPAIQQVWTVISSESKQRGVTILAEARCLLLFANLSHFSSCRKLLLNFLKELAEIHLKERLDYLSRLHQLDYHSLSFGQHKTQWGSCSREKKISLNIQMLFFPLELLDYVLIHELCHTKHMNHSQRFWNLVEKLEPNYKELRKSLRQAKQLLPFWVLYDD